MSRLPEEPQRTSSDSEPLTPNSRAEADSLDRLRELLLQEDRTQVAALRQELNDAEWTPDKLAAILPQSVRAANQKGEQLADALSPTLADAFDKSVRDDPQKLVDVISPIMGPAIRQSIRQTIQSMFQSINQIVEQSLSWKGLQWRLESWRTGLPFAQVVLMRTLVYRVEEVYLIHRRDGLLLAHVSDPALGNIDATIISGMLTAIEDFVRDSFRPGQKAIMDTIQFQDEARHRSTTCWIECGSKALLAAVIQGNPPNTVRERMRAALEQIHANFADELNSFQGDNQPFQSVSGYLEASASPLAATDQYLSSCLVNEFQSPADGSKTKRNFVLGLGALMLCAACGWLSLWLWQSHRQQQVVALLNPPSTVTITYRAGQVVLAGQAHDDWLTKAREDATHSPLIETWDATQVANLDQAWLAFLDRLHAEPGIEVTAARRIDATYQLRGLRDPLAADPDKIRREIGLSESQVRSFWTPFVSGAPTLVLARAKQSLQPPDTVTLQIDDGQLVARGEARRAWIDQLRLYASLAHGIQRLDVAELVETESATLAPLIEHCEAELFVFGPESATISADQMAKFDALVPVVEQLINVSQQLGKQLRIELTGYATELEGTRQERITLGETRAKNVWRGLVRRGVPGNIFITRGGSSRVTATQDPEATLSYQHRSVRFKVRLGAWE